ncbi:MAG TPA: hypothetical protein VIF15_05365 [Polyangiaceae bacterium]|jgi:hypothetical protein
MATAGLAWCSLAGFVAGSTRAEPPQHRSDAESCFDAAEAAQPLLKSHKLVAAQRELLRCAREGCPRAARSDCQAWLDQLGDKLPTVVFRAREARAGGDVAVDDVHVSADGEILVSDRLGETPVALDPGAHVLTFEHGGFPPVVQHVDLHEGESRRVVDVVFRSAASAAATHTAAADRDAAVPPAGSDGPSASVPGAAWGLFGGGVLAVGVGLTFEAIGLSARSHLVSTCMPTRTCAQSDVDSAHAQVLTGDIALGAGALLLAGAAVVYFTRSPDGVRHGANALRLQLTPIAGGFAAGIGGQL